MEQIHPCPQPRRIKPRTLENLPVRNHQSRATCQIVKWATLESPMGMSIVKCTGPRRRKFITQMRNLTLRLQKCSHHQNYEFLLLSSPRSFKCFIKYKLQRGVLNKYTFCQTTSQLIDSLNFSLIYFYGVAVR